MNRTVTEESFKKKKKFDITWLEVDHDDVYMEGAKDKVHPNSVVSTV